MGRGPFGRVLNATSEGPLKYSLRIFVIAGLLIFNPPALAQEIKWQSGADLVTFLDDAYESDNHTEVITILLELAGEPNLKGLYWPGLDWMKVSILQKGAPSSYAAAYMTMLWWGRNSEPDFQSTAAMMYLYAITRRIEAAARCDDNGVVPSLKAIHFRGQEIAQWYSGLALEERREILDGAMLTADAAPMHPEEFRVCSGGAGYMVRFLEKHGEDGLIVREGPGNITHVQPGYDPDLFRFVDDLEWQQKRANIRSRLREALLK